MNSAEESVQAEQNNSDSCNEYEYSSVSATKCRETNAKRNIYELTSKQLEKLKDFPEILEFIYRLQEHIKKQKRKISKLKKRAKLKVKLKHVATQTEVLQNEVKKSITEEITEAAQEALQTTTFVYEETSGMYYDYKTGYYYNAEYRLYYDGNTGTYLKYNEDTKEYEFHSQVAAPVQQTPKQLQKTHSKEKEKRKSEMRNSQHATKRHKRDSDIEEGECSDCSINSPRDCETDASGEGDDNSSDLDHSKQWPPCMRIIVEDSSITSLKPGSLHLLTYEGGTMGREGSHSILIPDINISKHHLKIAFDKEENKYLVTDLGSRNGTFLNSKRLSPSKMESDPIEIVHGSKLQLGGTTLLCHIHPGSQTCGHCEPGLLKHKDAEEKTEVMGSRQQEHKHQLKKLRKKFGITQGDQGKTYPGSGYTDRAQVRRETVGSQNPHEKTKAASLNESIDSENKGFKLLSKMGWKEGEALGKTNQGRLEPVQLVSNTGLTGVGHTSNVPTIDLSKVEKQKQDLWIKTQERYKQTKVQDEDMFGDS